MVLAANEVRTVAEWGHAHTRGSQRVCAPAVVSSEMVGWDCHWRTKGDVTIPRGVVHFAGGTKCDGGSAERTTKPERSGRKGANGYENDCGAASLIPTEREREREALSRHWGTPPPCCARRSFCSIGAQTDPWRTFHVPFLGANSPPPALSQTFQVLRGHTQWGFSHSGAMLFCCTAAIGDSNSKAAQPFHFGTAWAFTLSLSPWGGSGY